jgi:hypothetical protein
MKSSQMKSPASAPGPDAEATIATKTPRNATKSPCSMVLLRGRSGGCSAAKATGH